MASRPRPRSAPLPALRRLGLAALVLLAALAGADAAPRLFDTPEVQLEPVDWAAIDGWAEDDHAAAFRTFRDSCAPIVRARPGRDARVMFRALRAPCRLALRARVNDAAAARTFFERHFRPLRIAKLGEAAGFVTGYYEPVVDGSRFPNPEFHTPLYRRPPDLVSAQPVRAGMSFPNRGLIGRQGSSGIEPYYERSEIEAGAFDGKGLEIVWLRDPIDAFFMQIQGSGRVRLEDGTMLRVNYDAHNGHPYTPVGRVLIERGHVPRDEMSMDRIRTWMEQNREEAREVRHQNRSFVFFRVVGLTGDREAVGAQGIPLTAWRSIAVDRKLHVYGTPFFIDGLLPIDGEAPTTPFRRLMIGQDTGSAIIGPARADIYFGAGDEAGRIAGRLRHPAQFVMLVPNALDPVAAGRREPLPRPRPARANKTDASIPLPRSRPTG